MPGNEVFARDAHTAENEPCSTECVRVPTSHATDAATKGMSREEYGLHMAKLHGMAPPIPLLLNQEDIDAIKATAMPGNEVFARDAHTAENTPRVHVRTRNVR